MAGGRLCCVIVAAMAAVVGAMAAPASASHPPLGTGDMFAPDSYVEKPLAPDAPLDPNSATMAATLNAEIQQQWQNPQPWHKPTIDYQWCSPRVYTVPASQPLVNVTLPNDASALLKQQLSQVPIPPHAETYEGCPDRPLVIHQPSTNRMWDIWVAVKNAAGQWSARYGGLITPENGMHGVSQNPGHWEDPPFGFGRRFGTTATSFPKLAGLARISELTAGVVDHVIMFNMQAPAPCWRWPAQRMDGETINNTKPEALARRVQGDVTASKIPYGAILNNPAAPPYGSILRLPASLDLDALNLPPFTKTMAKAVQRHGLVLTDRGGQMGFITEVPPKILGEPGHAADADPYMGPGGILAPHQHRWDLLIKAFPWDKLQVLAARPGTNPCQTQ